MWIPKTISTTFDKLTASVVSFDTISGETVTPYGIAYVPQKGEKAVSLQIGN